MAVNLVELSIFRANKEFIWAYPLIPAKASIVISIPGPDHNNKIIITIMKDCLMSNYPINSIDTRHLYDQVIKM